MTHADVCYDSVHAPHADTPYDSSPTGLAHARFASHARARPDAPCVVFEGRAYSYADVSVCPGEASASGKSHVLASTCLMLLCISEMMLYMMLYSLPRGGRQVTDLQCALQKVSTVWSGNHKGRAAECFSAHRDAQHTSFHATAPPQTTPAEPNEHGNTVSSQPTNTPTACPPHLSFTP